MLDTRTLVREGWYRYHPARPCSDMFCALLETHRGLCTYVRTYECWFGGARYQINPGVHTHAARDRVSVAA